MVVSAPLLILMASLIVLGMSTGLSIGYVLFAQAPTAVPVHAVQEPTTIPAAPQVEAVTTPVVVNPSVPASTPAPSAAPAGEEEAGDDELSLDNFASFSMPSGGTARSGSLPESLTDEAAGAKPHRSLPPPVVSLPAPAASKPPTSPAADLASDLGEDAMAMATALSQPAGPMADPPASMFGDLTDPTAIAELENMENMG